MLNTVLGAGDTAINKMKQIFAFITFLCLQGKDGLLWAMRERKKYSLLEGDKYNTKIKRSKEKSCLPGDTTVYSVQEGPAVRY